MARIVLLLLLFLGTAEPNSADPADSSSGALIWSPLEVANTTPLYFGVFAPGNEEGGMIKVKTTDIGCDDAITLLTNDQTPAAFHVTGPTDTAYGVDVPPEVLLTSESGATLLASLMPVSPGQLSNGQDTFYVDASLFVPAQQVTDTYRGSFTVTVSYQ